MRIVWFACALLIALSQPAQANLTWHDQVARETTLKAEPLRPLHGTVCKKVKDLRNYLRLFIVTPTNPQSMSHEIALGLTNLLAHDPKACVSTTVVFVGNLERVEQLPASHGNMIYVVYRLQLATWADDPFDTFRDPYPNYRYTFGVERAK